MEVVVVAIGWWYIYRESKRYMYTIDVAVI